MPNSPAEKTPFKSMRIMINMIERVRLSMRCKKGILCRFSCSEATHGHLESGSPLECSLT
jgi:hypothetical protein